MLGKAIEIVKSGGMPAVESWYHSLSDAERIQFAYELKETSEQVRETWKNFTTAMVAAVQAAMPMIQAFSAALTVEADDERARRKARYEQRYARRKK